MMWIEESIEPDEFCCSKGRPMMLRPSILRSVMFIFTLLSTLFVAACSSGGEKAPSNTTTSNAPAVANSQPVTNTAASPGVANAKLNLNTASEDDFRAGIPGMGDRMVHEFEEYRPYRSIQQFRREIGKYVKPEQVAEYEKYVYVPIAENESDSATLQQIPGLDATEAGALIAGRPYASRDAFLTKLSEKVSEQELAVAKTYLSGP
jgi:DNA uptake protein ComE-like DNA-binding protein